MKEKERYRYSFFFFKKSYDRERGKKEKFERKDKGEDYKETGSRRDFS